MRQAKLLLSSIIPLVGLAIASPHVVDNELMQRNAPLQDFGILKNEKGFGSEPVLTDPELAAWAPDSQRQERNNASMEIIQDRSLELTRRQSCNTGYWYCSSFGRCCPQSQLCCSYGYCMNPENTCCPGGSCIPGFTCCNSGTCAPIGGECCLDGNYCEPGNVCVKLFDSGRIVCCTDLKCTAAIISGTTSYASRTTQVPAQVTPPPRTTDVVENQYETWYYTVTWWYLSFYWTTYQVQSTVTYTTIYSTTTYTTTATDEADASSRFAVLSQGLTFSAPASATSLKSLYDSPATGLEAPTFGTDLDTARVATGTSTRPINTIGRINGPSGDGGASTANALIAGWSFVLCGALSGILMLML